MSQLNKGLKIGHAKAKAAADNASKEWTKSALDALQEFSKTTELFTTEQIRESFPELPEPPDKRAWGHVARLAHKKGIIEAHGWVRAGNRSVHGAVVTQWRSLIKEKNT